MNTHDKLRELIRSPLSTDNPTQVEPVEGLAARLTEAVVDAANLVSHDGYFEVDMDAATQAVVRILAPRITQQAEEVARLRKEREAVGLDDAIERTYKYMGYSFDPSKAESWRECFKRQLKVNLAATRNGEKT